MRIRIAKHQLLRQLPDKVRTDLVGCNDLPDHFVFDVFAPEYPKAPRGSKGMVGSAEEKVDHVALKDSFPDVAAVLTGMEWWMFCVLLKYPSGATIHQLGGKLKHPESNLGNNVAVHIKGMREKFRKNHLAFLVQTSRANVLSAGSYKLIREA